MFHRTHTHTHLVFAPNNSLDTSFDVIPNVQYGKDAHACLSRQVFIYLVLVFVLYIFYVLQPGTVVLDATNNYKICNLDWLTSARYLTFIGIVFDWGRLLSIIMLWHGVFSPLKCK